jgi:hypothetical protein
MLNSPENLATAPGGPARPHTRPPKIKLTEIIRFKVKRLRNARASVSVHSIDNPRISTDIGTGAQRRGQVTGSGMSSVHTTLRVLEEVAHRQPIAVSELSRAMDLPKTTVQRCLISLREVVRLVDSRR